MNEEKRYIGIILIFFINLLFTGMFAGLFFIPLAFLLKGMGLSPSRIQMGIVMSFCFFVGAFCLQKVKRSIEIDKQETVSIQSYSLIGPMVAVVGIGTFLFVLFTEMPEIQLELKLFLVAVYSLCIVWWIKIYRVINLDPDQICITSLWGKKIIRLADIQKVEYAIQLPIGSRTHMVSYWYQLTLCNSEKIRIVMMHIEEINRAPLEYFKKNRIPVVSVQHGIFERLVKRFF